MPAWSFSALGSLETCAWRHYLTRVTKQVVEPETEYLRWGNYVHKAFEDRINEAKPLPTTLAGYEGMCERLVAVGATAEREACIDARFKPSSWWDKGVWCRSKWDVVAKHQTGKVMSLWDWKTGTRKPGSDQMRLCAAIGFLLEPKVDVINTGFVWLKDRKIDKEVFHRDQAKVIWADFLPRVRRFELAYEEGKWPKKPSGLCRKHCPVGKNNCEHCGS